MFSRHDQDEAVKTPPEAAEKETTPLGSTDPGVVAEQQPAESPLPWLGQRYEVLGELGRGGMGIVYRARDRETGDLVALKVLKPEIAAFPAVLERFKNELLLARKITHKNVCRTYELLRFGEVVVIAMEYVEGESLRALLARVGGLAVSRGLELARQICDGLQEAHAQGVVHRDLKPENILIDRNGHVKVMDFGIARSLETGGTQTGAVLGTPAYMAPEQAEGRPVDARTDIYALGLILYEIFTGRPAFSADTPVALAHQHIHGTPLPPQSLEPYLPGSLDRGIMKCLQKEPKRRFQSVAELHAALSQEETSQAKGAEVSLPPHLANSRRSDLLLLFLGALGLAAFLALAGTTVPETGLRVRLTREQFLDKARDDMTRRGWKPPSQAWVGVAEEAGPYQLLAQGAGYVEAQRALTGEFPPFLYTLTFDQPELRESGKADISELPHVVYEPGGALRAIRLPVQGRISPGSGIARGPALELAKREIQQTFGVDTDRLTPESEGTLNLEGRQGNTFTWVQRLPSGIEWHYKVEVYDRPAYLGRWITLPEGYRPAPRSSAPMVVGIVWFVVMLGLFFLRGLFSQVGARELGVLAGLAILLAAGFALAWWDPSPAMVFWWAVFYMMTFLFWLVVVTPVINFLAGRPWPHLTSSYTALLHLRPSARLTALAWIRGCACGLLVLASYTVLLRLGMLARLTWPKLAEPFPLASRVPLISRTAAALMFAVAFAYGVASTVSLARRWVASFLVLGLIGGVTMLADKGWPPDWFQLLLAMALGAALCRVLLAYDMLTLMVTVFTFSLWQINYPLTRMFESVGNWQYWFPLALWAALLVWALWAGFRPFWDRLGRRAAEMLE
ncbi:MAG TPA: serine/threonine-protein kinase [Terriglobales bacterium]|nr:serine/threonine-protein kinase [Terriglobales bacterium]